MQQDRWVTVSRDVFEYSMIPWVGSHAAPWLRASVRPDPTDPTGRLRVPERISDVFHAQHVPYQQATRQQLSAMGYPRLPEDVALEATERELDNASRVGDWPALAERAPELEQRKDDDDLAHRAEEEWKHDTAGLEEEVPRVLVSNRISQPPDEVVGIPPQLE